MAGAQEPPWKPKVDYAPDTPDVLAVIDSLKIESAIMLGLVTYGGFDAWGWGTRSFHVVTEGWFGMDTQHGGLDKFGHLYNTYVLGELFYLRLREYHGRQRVITVIPPALGLTLMTYVEIADGFSTEHGFSPEDFAMDITGACLSALRNAVPEVGEVVDLRFEYLPSRSVTGFHPFKDYSGQKFLAALKPAGLPFVRDTPLRYVELLAGYSAHGFKYMDRFDYSQKTTEVFFGVGLSLEQLLFLRLERHAGTPFNYLNTASHYFQVPYTYVPFTVDERHRPGRSD